VANQALQVLQSINRRMEHLSSAMEHQNQHQEQQQQQQVQWRRDKVQELCSKGYSQREISHMLQVGLATVNRDIAYLRDQAKENIKNTLMKGCQRNMRNVLLD
jgi:Trp operon repressor